MNGYGISAFVDGFYRGREIRDAGEDRKYNRKRQDRLDQMAEAREARAAEEHALMLKERGLRIDSAQIGLDEARRVAENEAAYRDIAAAGMDGFGAVTPSSKSPAPVVPTPADTGPAATPGQAAAQGVAQNLGLDLTMSDAAARNAAPPVPAMLPGFGAVPPPQSAPAQSAPVAAQVGPAAVAAGKLPASSVAPTPPQPQDLSRGRVVSVRGFGEDLFVHPDGRAFGMSTGQEILDPQILSIVQQQGAAPAMQASPENPLGPDYSHQFGQRGGTLADAGEVAARATAAIDTLPGKVVDAAGYALGTAANTVNRIINPWTGYVAGIEAPLTEHGALGPDRAAPPATSAGPAATQSAPSPASAPAPFSGPRAKSGGLADLAASADSYLGAVKPRAAGPRIENVPAAKQEAEAAAQVAGPAAAVAIAAAQQQAGGPLGAPGGDKLTDGQKERASTDALDHYTKVVVPQLVEEMVKRGDLDRAIQYQDFIEKRETQAAIKDWSAALVAATEGDMDAFAENIITVYNRLDYFGDDTTIVREDSGFTRDSQGNINGAVLTFKDENTGDTFQKIYNDPEQFYLMGLAATAPEEAFAWHEKKIAAAAEAQKGAVEKAEKEAQATEKRVDDVAKVIFESAMKNALPGAEPPITYAEARRQAQEQLGVPGAAAAPPPLLRRP